MNQAGIVPVEAKLLIFASVLVVGSQASAATGQYKIERLLVDSTFNAVAINDLGVIVGFAPYLGGSTYVFDSRSGSLVDIGAIAGISDIVGLDINNSGTVVGFYNRQAQTAFSWSLAGGIKNLGTIGGDRFSAAHAINNNGQVVGFSSFLNAQPDHAFIYDNAGIKEIPLPFRGMANGINDNGLVVGNSYITDGTTPTSSAFSWEKVSGAHVFQPVGGNDAAAVAVGNSGAIVGWTGSYFGPASPWQQAATFDSQGAVDIDSGSNNFSRALSVNSSGAVVGYYRTTANGDATAFYSKDGSFVDLESLLPPNSGWQLNIAQDVNNVGQIIGVGTYQGGVSAFIMSPVPEPERYLLALLGGLVFWARSLLRKLGVVRHHVPETAA